MHFITRKFLRRKWNFAYTSQIISTAIVRRNTTTSVEIDDIGTQGDHLLANAKPFEEIPKILSLPFVGTSWIYFPFIGRYSVKRLHHADRHKHQLYGDVYREKFGHLNVVTSSRPEDMETFVKHEGKYPTRGDFSTLRTYRESRKQWYESTGILTLQGKDWHDLRSKIQPHLMKPKAIHAYMDAMQNVAKDVCARIRFLRDRNEEVPHLHTELQKWALEAVAFVGLDTRLGCLENNLSPDSEALKMITAVRIKHETMNKLEAFTGNIQFWKYFSTPTWMKFTKAADVFSEVAYKYINNSLERLRKNPEETELTLLQSMLLTKGLDVAGSMVTVSDMLMAGIDTSSHTAAFLLYHLAKNPEKQETLYKDLIRIFPSKSDRMTTATFNELRYLKSCLKESIRLNPTVRSAIRRIMDHDIVISGYRVPAGTTIIVLQHMLHRSEKLFRDPDKFIPERWIDKENTHNPYAHLPFGIGPRSCIGRRLSELEIISLVTEILRNYRLEYHHEDIDMFTNLINVPDKPLLFKFIDR